MNNIYVSELPKNCKECSFQCYGSCLGGRDILNGDPYTGICHLKRQKPTDCPLKLLSDRLAEERKKVVQEIREKLKDMDFLAHETKLGERLDCFSKYKVLDILLRVERGE